MKSKMILACGLGFILFLLAASEYGSCTTRIIRTRMGALEGIRKEARYHKYFYAYYGIPYAKPPVGELRFQPPVRAAPWIGVLNATRAPPPCPQLTNSSDTGSYAGLEACTFLHVYTPETAKPDANFPVLFYIFGGQFKQNKPTDYEADFIMSRDIVLVTVSSRLGLLGFFSTGDTVIPGNMGLKDQLMAMKWTRENIYDYGGDPNKITLHGHSSGSMCVHLHTLSPQSKDYFDQVIMQSGFAYPGVWDQDFTKGVSEGLAILLNCSTHSSLEVKKCLLNKTAQELVLATEKLSALSDGNVMKPVIEDARVENAFLKGNPLFLPYQLDSKPWILGITSGEAASFISGYFSPGSNTLNINPNLLLPKSISVEWTSRPNHVDFIAQFLKTRFFGEEKISRTSDIADTAMVEVMTGIMYGSALTDVVQKYKGLKYVYLFDYRFVGGYTHSTGGRNGRFIGVGHADEVPLIFKENKTGIAEEDFEFGDEIITRWVNFVYSGNPNGPFPINTDVFGAWSAVTSPRIEFLRINRNGGMERDYFRREYGFWKKIPVFSKYFND